MARLNRQQKSERAAKASAAKARKRRGKGARSKRAAILRARRAKAKARGGPPHQSTDAPEVPPEAPTQLVDQPPLPAPSAPPPSDAAPPPAPSTEPTEERLVRPPRAGNGWELLQVEGGWLRYSHALGRLDSHCSRHTGGCKMDRQLKKGTIGLSMAWLAAHASNKDEHDTLNVALSDTGSIQDRNSGRSRFAALAAQREGLFRSVLDREAELRGGRVDEPTHIPVVSRF